MDVHLDAAAFKALSSRTRVELLKKLRDKPRSPTSLAHGMGLSVQAVDEHLRKLAAAGLAEKRKHAKWTYYALTPAGLHLVQPNRQPVYVLLGVSLLLLLASGLTVMDGLESPTAPSFQVVDAVVTSAPLSAKELQAQDTGPALAAAAPSPESAVRAELPWAAFFGFAGVAALLAAIVLWMRQNNRF